jgi:DNA-binding NarL/FixJ family response regulator
MQQRRIKVVIADDHRVYRDGLRLLLSKQKYIDVVGEAGNWIDLIATVEVNSPEVILTDIKMPGMDGIEGVKKIIKNSCGAEIVALSMIDDEEVIDEILSAGALGFITKSADNLEIIDAIDTVSKHQPYYCSVIAGIKDKENKRVKRKDLIPNVFFTDKELAIISYICQGYSTKQMADKLFVNFKAIEWHRKNIYQKMNVQCVAEMVIFAVQNNLYKIS